MASNEIELKWQFNKFWHPNIKWRLQNIIYMRKVNLIFYSQPVTAKGTNGHAKLNQKSYTWFWEMVFVYVVLGQEPEIEPNNKLYVIRIY